MSILIPLAYAAVYVMYMNSQPASTDGFEGTSSYDDLYKESTAGPTCCLHTEKSMADVTSKTRMKNKQTQTGQDDESSKCKGKKSQKAKHTQTDHGAEAADEDDVEATRPPRKCKPRKTQSTTGSKKKDAQTQTETKGTDCKTEMRKASTFRGTTVTCKSASTKPKTGSCQNSAEEPARGCEASTPDCFGVRG